MLKKHFFLTLCLGLLLLSSYGLAVEDSGTLSGAVVDESGVGLPGVEVTISGPSMMGTRTTITNTSGDFRIPQVSVGSKYAVTFTLKGFKQQERKDVRIELGKETRLAVIMKFGEITERIVVNADMPIVDPKSSTNQLNITKEVVETLANDRQYQSIMEMMPGAIPGNNPSMMGATDTDNMYQFDGMEATDPLTKTWSTAMNFDNFEEMQVVAQGAPAEYGRGTGAVINVVTKSGSNQIHGTARLSISKSDWNASAKEANKNFSDATRYLDEVRPSINLGGPIMKDHIWFFGSYERRNKWKPATWYMNPTEALNIAPTGSGRGYYKGHYASAKLTLRLGTVSMMGMWSEDPITMPQYYRYVNTPGYPNENDLIKTQGGWNFNAEATTTLGSNTYIIGRYSVKRNDLGLESYVQTGIRYEQNGYYWGAGNYHYETKRNHDQFLINISHFMDTSFGYHDIKVGAEYYKLYVESPIGNNSLYPGGERIIYNYLGQEYQRRVYEPQPANAKEFNTNITLFFQDKWEVTKGLTLNLGIRTEQGVYKNHDEVEVLKFKFGKQLAPRIGAAYSFGKNKISANWGRFFDIYAWWFVDNMQPDKFSRTFDLYYGYSYTKQPGWKYMGTYYFTAPASATTFSNNIKPQYMDEWGINYERILTNKLSASISYLDRRWNNKIEDYDLTGDGSYYFANENHYSDGKTDWGKTFRKYRAFILTLKKNLGDDKFQFLASYTLSYLKGFTTTDSESTWGDNPLAYFNALGWLANDTRHMVRFYGSYIAPFDIVIGLNLYWFSGKPFTNTVNMLYTDPDGTHPGFKNLQFTYNVDPLGTSGRFPNEWRMDLRLEKKFKIAKLFTFSAYIDIFNLLNQQNEIGRDSSRGDAKMTGPIGTTYVMTLTNPNFGKYNVWYAPMSFFLGAKIEW